MTWSYPSSVSIFFLIAMLVLVLICKNNGFRGKRGVNYYDWKEAFESYGEEWE